MKEDNKVDLGGPFFPAEVKQEVNCLPELLESLQAFNDTYGEDGSTRESTQDTTVTVSSSFFNDSQNSFNSTPSNDNDNERRRTEYNQLDAYHTNKVFLLIFTFQLVS